MAANRVRGGATGDDPWIKQMTILSSGEPLGFASARRDTSTA